ncbi:MAG: fumarate hydratase [Bacillus subtilis]|nr:fumarate hydratase [Bacillus subtilis]
MGLGGVTTALAVKVNSYPCHIASFPVAVNLQCHAARHKEVILGRCSAMIKLTLPLTSQTIETLHAGDYVLLSGIIHTARDAAHQKIGGAP